MINLYIFGTCTIPKTSKSKDTSLFGVDICPPNQTLSNKMTTKCVVPMDIKNRNMKATKSYYYRPQGRTIGRLKKRREQL